MPADSADETDACGIWGRCRAAAGAAPTCRRGGGIARASAQADSGGWYRLSRERFALAALNIVFDIVDVRAVKHRVECASVDDVLVAVVRRDGESRRCRGYRAQ